MTAVGETAISPRFNKEVLKRVGKAIGALGGVALSVVALSFGFSEKGLDLTGDLPKNGTEFVGQQRLLYAHQQNATYASSSAKDRFESMFINAPSKLVHDGKGILGVTVGFIDSTEINPKGGSDCLSDTSYNTVGSSALAPAAGVAEGEQSVRIIPANSRLPELSFINIGSEYGDLTPEDAQTQHQLHLYGCDN